MKRFILIALVIAFAGITGGYAQEAEEEKEEETQTKKGHHEDPEVKLRIKNFNLNKKGVALEGYDIVTYYTGDKPVPGNPSKTYTYKGIVYQFFTDENLFKFKINPDRYEPAYGGWDAYSMKEGKKVKPTIEVYKIINDRLYFFYRKGDTNTLEAWEKHPEYLKGKADEHWTNLLTP